jgi:uncharacterized membrane protein YuzA (DUF378 family)
MKRMFGRSAPSATLAAGNTCRTSRINEASTPSDAVNTKLKLGLWIGMGRPEIASEEEVAAIAARGSDGPAQNNAAQRPNQRAPASEWLAQLAPWHVQLLWLALGMTTAAYLKYRDWGMFEVIPWMIGLVVALAGWYAWSITWSVLWVGNIWSRAIYLLLGLAGVLAVGIAATEWPSSPDQLALVMARVAVGWVVPMILLRRRGWRVQQLLPEPMLRTRATHSFWQFSIGDLLVLTAGSSSYLGLMMANASLSWQEVVLEMLLLVCTTGILLVGLSWRRFWLAALASLAGTTALNLAVLAALNPDAFKQPRELLLASLILGPAFVLLLAAIAIVRRYGYRLIRFAPGAPQA